MAGEVFSGRLKIGLRAGPSSLLRILFLGLTRLTPARAGQEVVMAVLTSTATVTVNPAFMQEIKEVNQELWQSFADLRHRCSRPLSPGQCRHLVDWLSELRDQLALHFALEEAYGYFDEPLEVAPQLADKAGRLRAEHQELYADFSDLVDRAEQMFFDGQNAALALWVSPAFLDFDARLRDHEDRENELIYDAFDSDIGVGD